MLDRVDINGYRFNYEDLQVDNAYDYLDVYLYGVKQNKDKYDVKLYDGAGTELLTGQFASGSKEIRMIFNEDITRVPTRSANRCIYNKRKNRRNTIKEWLD